MKTLGYEVDSFSIIGACQVVVVPRFLEPGKTKLGVSFASKAEWANVANHMAKPCMPSWSMTRRSVKGVDSWKRRGTPSTSAPRSLRRARKTPTAR